MSALAVSTNEERVRALTPQLHAVLAEYAGRVAALDDSGEWQGVGLRDCADWLVVHAGFGRHMAESLVLAGRAMRELPEVAEAFSAGELSLDKVRSLSTVATAEDQGLWVELARNKPAPQLARTCREARNARIDAPERARAQRAARGLRFSWDELGMLRLSGALPPDEGALVRAVVENFERALVAERPALPLDPDPAEDPRAALRADALVMACHAASGAGRDADPAPSPVLMTVHVDLGVLTGETPNGRCHLENGPALSTAVARRLGCDASVVTMIERDGTPIHACREKPIVSVPMRRGVRSRDRGCLFPGCPAGPRRTQPHHIHHWADLGPTEMWNLASLCKYHHHQHHLGEYEILRTPTGDLRFVDRDGNPFGTAPGGYWKKPRSRAAPR